MNSKERMIRAIRHEEPDRVPLGAVSFEEWSPPFLAGVLLPYFRLAEKWKPDGPPTWSVEAVDKVVKLLGIDFKQVAVEAPTEFRKKAVYDSRIMREWGIRVAPNTFADEWGVIKQLVGYTHGRMISHPLKNPDSLDSYAFPDPHAEGRYDKAERYLRRWREEYAVSAYPELEYLFDHGWFLCGFQEQMVNFYKNPTFIEKLYDRIHKYFIEVAKRLAEMGITIFCINDDVAGQTGMILAPNLWRKHIKPRMKEVVDAMKKRDVYVAYHSDGVLQPIIPDLIEVGIDILNPIQPECLDPAEVKREYGDKITLSGTISMQKTLSHGKVEDVRNEVIQRIENCGQDGGLIISPSNQATIDIPIQNFLAIYETTKQYGLYPAVHKVRLGSKNLELEL